MTHHVFFLFPDDICSVQLVELYSVTVDKFLISATRYEIKGLARYEQGDM